MKPILLIEDNQYRPSRRSIAEVADRTDGHILVRMHHIVNDAEFKVIEEIAYKLDSEAKQTSDNRASIALKLLDNALTKCSTQIVVAGSKYGRNQNFIKGLLAREVSFVVELRPRDYVEILIGKSQKSKTVTISSLIDQAQWKKVEISEPTSKAKMQYLMADLARVLLPSGKVGRLFAAQRGGIEGIHSSTIVALSSVFGANLRQLTQAVGWVRWIRPVVRRLERNNRTTQISLGDSKRQNTSDLLSRLGARSNILLGQQQDKNMDWLLEKKLSQKSRDSKGLLRSQFSTLNVIELFAGAGAMGLGFLMASQSQQRYRLAFSGEVHPIYVETLKHNHAVFNKRSKASDAVPEQIKPLDLRTDEALEIAVGASKEVGGTQILIGGPPCQGFSSANRNSGYSNNPYNQLVDVFLKYVEAVQPLVFLMENVQGILWVSRSDVLAGQVSVVQWVVERMAQAGYIVFPKLLDAAWYGVPQHRNRFFLMGIHKDLKYEQEQFGNWGPFPFPTHGPGTAQDFVTVREAIADLPMIGNGWTQEDMPYKEPTHPEKGSFLQLMRQGAPKGIIYDHVTSKHAEYVIERYKHIPAGGNWESIAHKLTNYADIKRTHSNIYRRLEFDEPSITIGHYRKSMLVHPSQDRGLSLREACRLQSIPDWFRFAGTVSGRDIGLSHKQQQLANAVCPLVTKAIAEFIFKL